MTKKDKVWIPVFITGLVILYYGFIVYLLFTVELPLALIIIGIPLSILLTVMMIQQCVNRIKEIHKGENDDLSQY